MSAEGGMSMPGITGSGAGVSESSVAGAAGDKRRTRGQFRTKYQAIAARMSSIMIMVKPVHRRLVRCRFLNSYCHDARSFLSGGSRGLRMVSSLSNHAELSRTGEQEAPAACGRRVS